MSRFPMSASDELKRAVEAARRTFRVHPEPDGRYAVVRTLPGGTLSAITSCLTSAAADEVARIANNKEAAAAARRWSDALDPIDRPLIAEFYHEDNS